MGLGERLECDDVAVAINRRGGWSMADLRADPTNARDRSVS